MERQRDSEFKRRLKLDSLRIQKRFDDMLPYTRQPTLSPKNDVILYHSRLRQFYSVSAGGGDWVQTKERQMREASRRKQERVHVLKQEQMREVTGRPVISAKAQRVEGRSHEARMQWKQHKDEKVYQMKSEKASRIRQIEDMHLEKQGKYLNKQSEWYLSKKENVNMQPVLVEERLITYGKFSQAKR